MSEKSKELMPILELTSVKDLETYAKGNAVMLPPFAENQPFVAMLKRPSIVSLMANGLIPNALLPVAMELFDGEESKEKQDKTPEEKKASFEDTRAVLEVIAKSSLAEPTFDEITDSGMELTEAQLFAIYNYTQVGIKDMLSFRPGKKD
jgi:hypothetical protein|nr:MAG TPA: hypothetical protein [Caudoviricetes sp.]